MALDINREIASIRNTNGQNWLAMALRKIQDYANGLPTATTTPTPAASTTTPAATPVAAASIPAVIPTLIAGPGITITGAWPSLNFQLTPGFFVTLTAQAASISSTNIFTPLSTGLYLISVQHMTAAAGTAGTLRTVIGWSDDVGARTRVIATDIDLTSATDEEDGIAIVRAVSGTPITYTTTLSGGAGSPAYDLFIYAKQLL